VTTLLQRGGTEMKRKLLAEELNSRGYEIVVICLGRPAPVGEELSQLGFAVRYLGGPPFYGVRALMNLAKALRSVQPDVVHSSSVEANVLCAVACRFIRHTRHVAEEVGVPLDRSRLARIVDGLALRSASSVIADSPQVKAYLVNTEHVCPTSVLVYPPVADLRRFGTAEAARDRDLVVSVGRLDHAKGHDILLRAVALLTPRHSSLRVRLFGSGPEAENLLRLAQDLGVSANVDFCGEVTDVAPHLATPGCFVLPSRTEGSPVALVEALAAGCAVVATRVGGVTEIVESGSNGFLVPPEDPKALAEAMGTVLTMSAGDYESLSRAARQSVRTFTPDAFAGTAVLAYEAVLGGRRQI